MKIFLDTAETRLIKPHFNTGLVDGVTTNPSLIAKSGRNPLDVYQELIDMGVPDVSMEVMGSAEEMTREGLALSERFGTVATIKVPCTPDGLSACSALSAARIDVNVTLVFSVAQSILCAKAGAKYVSPFVGRIDDLQLDGLTLIKDIASLYKARGVRTEVLSASIRDVRAATKSFEYGADIVTMPPAILEKMYSHALTDKGLEIFDRDAKNIKR